MAFSLGGKSGSKPGLEALIAAEKKAAAGMNDLTRSAASAAREFVSFQQGITRSAAVTAKASADRSPASQASSGPAAEIDTAGISGGLSQVGDQVIFLAARMRAALADGLAPLQTIAATTEGQFNRLAGTVTELARRIDSAMKSPAKNTVLKNQIDAIGFAAAATASPAAKMALAFVEGGLRAYRAWYNVRNIVTSAGDVAKNPLDRLANFTKTITGANAASASIRSIGTSATASIGGVRNLGREILVALGVFGVVYKLTSAVKDFFVGGVKGAIDLNETVNVTKETFGKLAGGVQSQAAALSKYGFGKNEILGAANSFGALAQGAKMSEAQSAKLSATFVQLTADAVSFKNVSFAEASQKFQSALAGESKPLREWGVLINEDLVKTRAFSLGLSDGKEDLSEYAKMMARASLISEQMRKANGDLAATSGSAANQFRAAGGGVSNFAVSIGQLLLPAVQKGVIAFNELLSSVVETFETNKGMFESWGESVSGAVDRASFGVRNFGSYWRIAQISATQSLANVYTTLDVLPENFSRITAYVGRNWSAMLKDFVTEQYYTFTNLIENAKNFGTAIVQALKGEDFSFQWKSLAEGFKATAEKFPDLVKPVWVDLSEEMGAELNNVAKREAARAKAVVPIRPKGPAPITDADAPGKGDKDKDKTQVASLAELGTKEAYTAIVKAQAQAGDKNEMRRLTSIGGQQLAVQGNMASTLEKLAKMGVPVFRGG